MKLTTKHIIFWRIVLLLFVFSNSGFTMLVTQCKMENKSCCAKMTNANACAKTQSSHSATTSIKSNNGSCMEIKLVGGSTSTKQGIVEHSFHIPSLKEITSFVVSLNSFVFSQLNSLFTFSTKLLASAITSVEKYVLTTILRI